VKKTVKVGDYFFAPASMTVPRRSTITWKWLPANGDEHDVKVSKAPKGAKRFQSAPATTDYEFGPKRLRVRGKYTVICTYHRQIMRQTIVVK
jgi:plastocyanin